MALDPLSLLILLFFLAVVALALTLWFLLTLGQRRLEPSPLPKRIPAKPAQTTLAVDLNNDDYRGAKANSKPSVPERPSPERPPPKSPTSEGDNDAFERFIRSKNDELEF